MSKGFPIATVTFKFNIKALKEIETSQLMQMQYEQLRLYAKALFKVSNQRYSRLEKTNLAFTPALDAVNDGGGKFYLSRFPATKPELLNQLRAEVFRSKRFIEMKTSTISEAKKFDARMKKTLGGDVTKESGAKVWELYRKAEEENFAGIKIYGSDNVAQMIYNSMEDMSDSDLLKYVSDVLTQAYETAIEEMEEALADDADFFDLW